MDHEAARPKGRPLDDEPNAQPMRPVLRGQIARNPSSDQKRARRLNLRKSADFNETGGGYVPGHMQCSSCGYKGHPRLGDTGAECGHCGSYSVSSTKPRLPLDNARSLNRSDYQLLSALAGRDPNAYLDKQCPGCGGSRNERNPEGTCNSCMSEARGPYDGYGVSGSDEDTWNPRQGASRNPYADDYVEDDLPTSNTQNCPQCGSTTVDSEENDGTVTRACPNGRCGHVFRSTGAKQATILDTEAWKLNPGDQIRMPNGRTQKVLRTPRPHETDPGGHVYVDTDGGTTLVERHSGFQVVPHNSQQQSLPGYGNPSGNSNSLPGDPQNSGHSNQAPSSKCPQCGGPGTLRQSGQGYVCSRCGYNEAFGGAGGNTFSDASSVVRTFSTVNIPIQSAVARRATAVLNQEETQ